MSNEQEPLSPQQEEVRRLLAGARHTGPTPPEVVARLDSVLDDLARESGPTAPAVDLARRRRRVASLLVAAAAVVVIGVGVNQVISPEPQGDASSAGDTGVVPGAAESESRPEGQPKAQSDEEAAESAQDVAPLDGTRSLLELRRDTFADDVTAARRDQVFRYSGKASSADRAAGVLCSAHAWGSGRFVPVSYAGTPAVLVLRRPVGDTQVAEVFLCGGEEPVRSVTLPAP